MKTKLTTKNLALFIFLIAIIPYGKLELFNGIVIIINLTLIFTKNALSVPDYLFLFTGILGALIIAYYKDKKIIIGFLLTYMWLTYRISWFEFLNSFLVSMSIIIYLIVSIFSMYKTLKIKQ